MADYKTVRLHKSTWLVLKRRALEEGTSLLELVEKLSGGSEGRRGGVEKRAEVGVKVVEAVEAVAPVELPTVVESVKAVKLVPTKLSNVFGVCKRCGHAAGVHGAFSCVKGCECGGYVT
jgi:hypothetical protein